MVGFYWTFVFFFLLSMELFGRLFDLWLEHRVDDEHFQMTLPITRTDNDRQM